jgi:tetratricopeptide repeat protein 30
MTIDCMTRSLAPIDQSAGGEPSRRKGTGAYIMDQPAHTHTHVQGHYEMAREKYLEALTMLGYQADLAYNIALCHFRLKQFGPALKFIMEIIEVGGWVGGWGVGAKRVDCCILHKHVGDFIPPTPKTPPNNRLDQQRGVQEHPELSVGSNADGVEVRSVGNSPVLQETYLIEAFNLKVLLL